MGTPAFPDLGRHCSVSDCRLIDFLPFSCDGCQKVFCLEHHKYDKHQCPSGLKDVTVLVCPLCAKAVRIVPNEDPNITWERHAQTDCDSRNYEKATKKPRCPVPVCKEVLTFSNKVLCKTCKVEVCLKHRFGSDHNCDALKSSRASNLSFKGIMRKFGPVSNEAKANQSPSQKEKSGAQAWRASLLTAVSSVKSSADAGMSKLATAKNDMVNAFKASTSKDQANTPTNSAEWCPRCGMQFTTVEKLIHHVDAVHCKK